MLNRTAKRSTPLFQPPSWQALPHGTAYCNAIGDTLAPWLPQILGYQLLKIGALSGEIHWNLPLRHQITVVEKMPPNPTALSPDKHSSQYSVVRAALTELPFIDGGMNACLLANTLNFSHDPHQILREAKRVLADDGYLFVSLFNPLNPLIFKQKLGGFRFRQYPTWRILDWLALLNFDVLARQSLSVHGGMATPFSPLTLLVAQKRTYPLTLNPQKVRSTIRPFFEPAGAFNRLSSD